MGVVDIDKPAAVVGNRLQPSGNRIDGLDAAPHRVRIEADRRAGAHGAEDVFQVVGADQGRVDLDRTLGGADQSTDAGKVVVGAHGVDIVVQSSADGQGLHRQLKEHAGDMGCSLNSTIVDALRKGLSKETTYDETEREKVLRVMREAGLWEPLGPIWDDLVAESPGSDYEELWEELKNVPPLSDVIIEERGPR